MELFKKLIRMDFTKKSSEFFSKSTTFTRFLLELNNIPEHSSNWEFDWRNLIKFYDKRKKKVEFYYQRVV